MNENTQEHKHHRGDIDVTKIVGIVSGAIITIALIAYFAFTDWIASQHYTGDGPQYASPVINQLPLLLTFIGTAIAAFVGNAVLNGRIAKKVEGTQILTADVAHKVEKIEKQTNGRTHVRDAQIDALVLALSSAYPDSADLAKSVKTAMQTSRENDNAPEDNFTEEQHRLQQKLIQISADLAKLQNKPEGE